MSSRWYLRITLYGFVFLLLALWVAGLEFTFFTGALVGLAFTLASAAFAYFRRPEDTPFAISLAYLFAVAIVVERAVAFGLNGWLAVGLALVLSFLGAALYVYGKNRLTRARLLAGRNAARKQHLDQIAERRQLADRDGLPYEERSATLAIGFGRVEQEVPKGLLASSGIPMREWTEHSLDYERMETVAEHAAGLEAESVIRTQVGGFPVTLFDLEVIVHERMAEIAAQGVHDVRVTAEIAKHYLSVGKVTLPFPLPFYSSAYHYRLIGSWSRDTSRTAAASDGSVRLQSTRFSMMTENDEMARLLVSVPEVRRSAQDQDAVPPWFIDGDRLVSSDLSVHGAPASVLHQWVSRLGTLIEALPWADLERFRTDAPARQADLERFYRTFRPHPDHGAVVERWEERPHESGIRVLIQTERTSWSRPVKAGKPVEA